MIIIAGSLTFDPSDRDDVLASLAEVTEASRRDAGCLEYFWGEDLERRTPSASSSAGSHRSCSMPTSPSRTRWPSASGTCSASPARAPASSTCPRPLRACPRPADRDPRPRPPPPTRERIDAHRRAPGPHGRLTRCRRALRRPVRSDRAHFDRALARTGWSGRRHRLGPGAGEADVIVARAAPGG